MKSDIADLKNTGGRAAGTLTAAAFLREFVEHDAVDSSRHRRHRVSRERVGVASEGSDGHAGARVRRPGRIARAQAAPTKASPNGATDRRAHGVKAARNGRESARPYEPEKNPAIRRLTAGAIKRRKGKTIFPIATAYDAPFGQFVERAGIDVILVGDSVGNVVLGFDETTPVTLENMIYHTQAVARGTTRAHIMADMPFGSYQVSNEDALRSAIALVKEGGACSVKLEGGRDQAERIRAITGAGIPVVGHIGVTPQTAGLGPGFKMRTHRDRLIDDARSVETAGAYAIVLEVVDYEISREITEMLSIPTIGIGSGPHCDSQVLVLHDILGMYPHSPSFAKRYAEVGELATQALQDYAREVSERIFPAKEPRARDGGRLRRTVPPCWHSTRVNAARMLETNDPSDPLVIALRAFERVLLASDATPRARRRGAEGSRALQRAQGHPWPTDPPAPATVIPLRPRRR